MNHSFFIPVKHSALAVFIATTLHNPLALAFTQDVSGITVNGETVAGGTQNVHR